MSLLTVLRSPSSENTSTCTDSELEEDVEDGSPRSRTSSFEGFFASKGSAFALPDGDFARKASKHGGEMQMHLQSMVNLLRDDDILRLVVKLEGQFPGRVRYLTVVSAFNEDDIEESIAMGVDWLNSRSTCTIGLVLPLWRDTSIEFDGDGGFSLLTNYRKHILKPVSVQTMWTAVQWIHRCSENSRKNNQYPNGLSHQWCNYYSSRISSDQGCINEWHEMEDVSSKLSVPPIGTTPEQELMMKLIRHKLKEVMMKVDLEEVTSRQIRQNLEEEMQMDLKEYKQYIDKEMLTILGQLDSASQIYDHVYLGSEWNASNLEELKENGVGYILNISREIDNFFYGTFKYYNIRLYDEEESDLMPHWEDAYKFINEAKINGSKVLVHCRMGMSRSASTVIAYGMKEYGTSLNDTMKHVKAKRSVVNPNSGFWKQLITYEGILNSSKHRYNELFTSGRRRTHSADLEGRKRVKRRRNRRQNKSKTVAIGTKLDPGVIIEDSHSRTLERGVFSFGDEESDDEMDEGKCSSSSGYDPCEEALKTWENAIDDSNPSSPPNSRPESPDLSRDELDDVVGGLSPSSSKARRQKSPSLHRAHSVPSLVGDASKSVDVSDVIKPESIHRCNSLKEFLSGKVAARKKDYGDSTLGKHSGSLGLIESKDRKQPVSPSEEERRDNTTEVIVIEKPKLHRTLSYPTGSTCVEPGVVKSEQEPVESEKEDVGSVPDQGHTVVHRDVHTVVKSGTVKRQSRNFEEGRVNLPWEWEEALLALKTNENTEHTAPTEDPEPVKPEEQVITEDEPPVGLVKMHAQKFQGKFEQEGKNSGSEGEEDNEGNLPSPEREKPTEAFSSSSFRKVVVVDANSSPVVVETKVTESDRIKEEMQKAKALFEKDVKKVNEDMIKEKSMRRNFVSRKSTETVDEEEKMDTSITEESQESPQVSEDVAAIEENSPNEDPLPGTVLKHLQAIEYKYRKTVTTKPVVVDVEENSPQRDESEQDSLGVSKRVYVFQKSEENDVAEVGSPSSKERKTSDNKSFDVDVLLRRVNEDMKKEKELRRVSENLNDFKVFDTSSEEESILKDVPETENSEILKDQNDSESSEIPRPGIVKRSTDLLLGKARHEKTDEEQDESAATNEEDESNLVEADSTVDKNLQTQEADVGDGNTIVESDTTEKGLVKRHTLVYEGRLPLQVDEEVKDSTSTEIEKPNEKPNAEEEGASDDVVDSSGIVSVKLRLKLMEEVIQGANEREYHKQRTRKALAALEDKRKQIETEQKKIECEIERKELEKMESSDAKGDVKDCEGEADDTKIFFISGEENDNPTEARTSESAHATTEDVLNADGSPCLGNVRIRTLVLEERIHGSTEDLDQTKPGTSVRRHESMPRTTRPVDRPIVRQRSMSDLETTASTSKGKTTSSNRWSLDLRRDKNKLAKMVGAHEDDVPDNDRDSEKLSDDMSEKSDKTDDCLSKQTDIFELGDRDFELSKELNQKLDLDNKGNAFELRPFCKYRDIIRKNILTKEIMNTELEIFRIIED